MNKVQADEMISITEKDRLLFMGSCFAQEVKRRCDENRIQVQEADFGPIFNHRSIIRLIFRALNEDYFKAEDFFFYDNYWFSFDLHGSFARTKNSDSLIIANQELKRLKFDLESATHLFLSLGTRQVHKAQNTVVANCHKQDRSLFEKQDLSYGEIHEDLLELMEVLNEFNPDLKVVFTVSPVRYLREGKYVSAMGKAVLSAVCQELEYDKSKSLDNVFYLPVYEYVSDSLRDYSYYGSTTTHPTRETIDLVFAEMFLPLLSPGFQEQVRAWQDLKKKISHKAIHPRSNSNVKFLENLRGELETFTKKYGTKVSEEIELVKEELKRIRQDN